MTVRPKLRLGVLVSGNGTNLQSILDAAGDPAYPAQVKLVISNQESAFALERARRKHVPAVVISHKPYPSREEFEGALIKKLDEAGIDLVILAGFMRVLSPLFIRKYADSGASRIINIHPSLLPAFPGTHAIEKAWDYGVKVTGVTVHLVDEGTDTGPIILQREVTVDPADDLKTLEGKIHRLEHTLYPEAIRLYAEGRLKVEGRKIRVR